MKIKQTLKAPLINPLIIYPIISQHIFDWCCEFAQQFLFSFSSLETTKQQMRIGR